MALSHSVLSFIFCSTAYMATLQVRRSPYVTLLASIILDRGGYSADPQTEASPFPLTHYVANGKAYTGQSYQRLGSYSERLDFFCRSTSTFLFYFQLRSLLAASRGLCVKVAATATVRTQTLGVSLRTFSPRKQKPWPAPHPR